MKKFLLSAAVIVIFTIYALHINLDNNVSPVIAIRTTTPGFTNTDPTNIPVVSLGPTPVPTAVSTATSSGRYKNGTYTGSVADAFYGNIQVQVTISGGRISDVQFLQFPNDRRTSQMINAQADPMLAQEAIQAQSAQVSGVTGATASSGAFVQSLQSALQQAM
jgi:uncharacterized protein with FMN-binding domain